DCSSRLELCHYPTCDRSMLSISLQPRRSVTTSVTSSHMTLGWSRQPRLMGSTSSPRCETGRPLPAPRRPRVCGSDVAPNACSVVAEHHRQGDAELSQTNHARERHVPGWSLRRDLPGKLEGGGWHSQDACQEYEQDQPEGPAPAADDAH